MVTNTLDELVYMARNMYENTTMVGLNHQIKPTMMVLFMGMLKCAGSRYFINARVAGAAERGQFDALTDPNGFLAAMVDEDFIHITDNDVQYYARTANPDATFV